MRTVRVENLTQATVLAERAMLADNPWTRARGLLGRPAPAAGEGMVLVPCNQVHMFGMGYAIDVCFVARDGEVLRVVPDLRPWRMTAPVWDAHYTVELPVGALAGTEVGDRLSFVDAD